MNKFDLIIIGEGLAGKLLLSEIISLLKQTYDLLGINKNFEILMVSESKISNSSISGGEVCLRGFGGKTIRQSIIENGKGFANHGLIDLLIDNLESSISRFKQTYKTKDSKLGMRFNITKTFNQIDEQIIQICTEYPIKITKINGSISDIHHYQNKINGITVYSSGIITNYQCEALAICSGGFGNIFKQNDNIDNNSIFNTIGLCIQKGIKTKNLNFLMIHPFGVQISNGLRQFTCEKTDLLAGKTIILGNNRYSRYITNLLSKHGAHNKFKTILRIINNNGGFTKIQDKNYFPIVHYTIGGIDIDHKFQTNVKGIYSYGECAIGCSGIDRIGGIGLLEIIVFSGLIAKNIISYLNKTLTNKEKHVKTQKSENIINNQIYTPSSEEIQKIFITKQKIKELLDFNIIFDYNEKVILNTIDKIQVLHDCTYKTLAINFLENILNFHKKSKGLI